MKPWMKNGIAGLVGIGLGVVGERGAKALMNRFWPDPYANEFDENHELNIGDGLDDDLKEDPPED